MSDVPPPTEPPRRTPRFRETVVGTTAADVGRYDLLVISFRHAADVGVGKLYICDQCAACVFVSETPEADARDPLEVHTQWHKRTGTCPK